ncbi:MAG: hypothetical protein J0H92_20865 [Sphingobacteriales bacterium]|nr:hypothetical protein [Sphingobacteriales bacterium]
MMANPGKNLVFLLLLAVAGCGKDSSGPDGGDNDNPVTYSFTNPVNVRTESIVSNGSGNNMLSKTEIRGSYIYSILPRSVSSNNYPETLKKTIIGVSNTSNTGFTINPGSYVFSYAPGGVNKYQPLPVISLFTVDNNGEYIYRFNTKRAIYIPTDPPVLGQVYKGNLSTGTSAAMIAAGDLAQMDFLLGFDLKAMRADDAGNVYIASLASNGCIVKVSATGQISVLASGLINPGYFTIHNGFLYVPINVASGGKVIRIDINDGTVSTSISNLTNPVNLAIDRHGNIVVRSLTSVSGANYHRYDIYKPDGQHIANIKDANGISLLSDIYENMPMYIDGDNNLYFYHADGVSVNGSTSNNPTGQKGIYQIALIKN